jgi:hydrogenase/urease accessory protein HupE
MRTAVTILLTLLLSAAVASAHPSVTNNLEAVVHADRIAVTARISLPQVDIANPIEQEAVAGGFVDAAKLKAAIEAHGPYLLSHLLVSADGVAVEGKLKSVVPPAEPVTWRTFEQHEAVYEIEYTLPRPRPAKIRIEQDALKEFSRLGQAWAVSFVTRVRQDDQKEFAESLLTREEPVTFAGAWSEVASTATTATTGPAEAGRPLLTGRWAVARQYLAHGFEHILFGYDHLLFVAALVIAATRLWDLVRVVSAFAAAHTLTLTLSVLDIVRLPSSIVEPVIAASIVFVALQNVLLPRQSRGTARLAVAFAFGLFHGLGFAGGLLEAMEGMPAISLAVALIAFTIGVELAHQALIVPLYFLIRPLRRGQPKDAPAPMPVALRVASVAICLAGAFYLVLALRGA